MRLSGPSHEGVCVQVAVHSHVVVPLSMPDQVDGLELLLLLVGLLHGSSRCLVGRISHDRAAMSYSARDNVYGSLHACSEKRLDQI